MLLLAFFRSKPKEKNVLENQIRCYYGGQHFFHFSVKARLKKYMN